MLLLLRLSAVFLLRLAERQCLPLLIHEPPRSTRLTLIDLLPVFIIHLEQQKIIQINLGDVSGFVVTMLYYRYLT